MLTNSIVNWIARNEWVFRYVAYSAWAIDVFLLIDFVFGIHWLRDLLLPGIFAGLLIGMYIYI